MKSYCRKKERSSVLARSVKNSTGTLTITAFLRDLAVFAALLAFPVAAQSSTAGNQISGMITLEDLSEFWFVPAIAVGTMVIYLLFENRQRLVANLAAIVSRKKVPSLIETVLSEDEAELLSKAPLAKRLIEKQRKREAGVRGVEEHTSSELDIGTRIRTAFKRLLPSGTSPDTIGGQLAIGAALKRSGVAFDLERLIKENKDDRGLISAVVASLRGDFDTIKDKQSKIKSRNKKLAKLEQALEELARLHGTISSERENLAELRRLHAGLDEITADESTTFEALLKEFSEAEQEFTYVSQVCSVVATISAQMRAELAATESGDASFEARKAEIEKMQQNAIRLQQLLSEKRERLSRLLSAIVRMRNEIVKAGIDDLQRLQEARREEAAIHHTRVSELAAQITAKEREKKEIEKRRETLDLKRNKLDVQIAQQEERISELTAELESAKRKSETSEAARAKAEQLHAAALAEKERIISALAEGKRIAEARRDELERELGAVQAQHGNAQARITELEEQERSLHESIRQGTAAIMAVREELSSKERKFEEEKSELSASERAKRQAELAAQRREFEEMIGRIQVSVDASHAEAQRLQTDLEAARKEASAFKGALEIANSAVKEAQETIDDLASELEKKEQEIRREREAMRKERAKLSLRLSELSKKLSVLRAQRGQLQSEIADVTAGKGRLESQLKVLQGQRLEEPRLKGPKTLQEVLQQRRKLLRNLIALIREERTLQTSAEENNTKRADTLHAQREELRMLDTMLQQECDITNAEVQRIRAEIKELERRRTLLERDTADLRGRIAAIQRQPAREISESIKVTLKDELKDKLERLQADYNKLKEEKDRVDGELADARNELEEQKRKKASAEGALAKARAELANLEEEIRKWLEEALVQIQQREKKLDAQQQAIDAERGRADEAERTIVQIEQRRGAVLAQMREENAAEQERSREELRAAHEQELEALRVQLARFEGIEASNTQLQTDLTARAQKKKELEERLRKKISELLARIDRINKNISRYNSEIKELESLGVSRTDLEEEDLARLRREVQYAEGWKSTWLQDINAARAQLAELEMTSSPEQDVAAAQEAEREAEEAKRRQEFIALNIEFNFHLTAAQQFDEQGNYDATLSELDLAESVCNKLPPQIAEQFKDNIRLLREKITAQASSAGKDVVKTVWLLVAVGPKDSIRWGFHKKDTEQRAISADKFRLETMFPDLTNLLHVGFIFSSEKLLREGIKIGSSPSASDIVVRSDDPTMKTISPMHLGLKLRKDSSELLVVSNNTDTRLLRVEDKTWEILPQGTTVSLQNAVQLILGRGLNSPFQFILAPLGITPELRNGIVDRLSDMPFSKFWISFAVSEWSQELPEEVSVLVPKKGNYDVKMTCGGKLVEEIILYRKGHSMGRNPEADIFITAQHKEDIRTISKSGYTIEQDKDGNYFIKLTKEDSYGGVFILGTEEEAEGKSRKQVTRYRKVEDALALNDGMEFCLDREGEFCFIFYKKKRSAIKVVPDLRKWQQLELHYGEAKPPRVVGVFKPEGEFEISVDNKKLSADRIMLWKGSMLIGKNPDCDIKIVAPMLVSCPKVEGLVEGSSVISRHHAVIKFEDGKYTLYDNSTYGTFVQGQLVGKGNSVTLQDEFLIWFASQEITVKFMTQQIPESEIPKEVRQVALVFTHKPTPAAEPELPQTKEEKARLQMESTRVNAIFVQQTNADVMIDGQPLYDPKRFAIIKPILSIGTKETNDIVLRCDSPKLRSLLRDEQARIEIKPNGEVHLVVLRQLLKGNKVFVDGGLVETRGEQVIRIVPDLLHEKKTFVCIGFGDPGIELVYNITPLKTIARVGRQWKQAIISFKAD